MEHRLLGMGSGPSVDKPLGVNWIDQKYTGTPGLVGMTLCPGRKGHGASQIHNRSVDADVTTMLEMDPKVDALLGLMEAFEYRMLQADTLAHKCREQSIDYLWYPMPDGGTPRDMRSARSVVNAVVQKLRYGENIVIHCKAGLGRTGLLASCILIRLGWSAEDAMRIVRQTRKGTIENKRQEAFVNDFGGRQSQFRNLPG
jgi:protein-tyrosine phosphatase